MLRCRIRERELMARIFPQCKRREITFRMMARRQLIGQVLVLLVFGLVFGPFAAVPNARALDMMSAMADDVPCRPHEPTTAPDIPASCPLMAACMANCLPGVPVLAGSVPDFSTIGILRRPGSDPHRSLREPPPARPPRT